MAPDDALEVDAPRLGAAGREAQRLERNGELGAPANLGDAGSHLPGAVPVDVEAAPRPRGLLTSAGQPAAALPFEGDLPVVLDAGGIGAEDEAVLAVAVGVEDDPEAVHVVERRVAARVRDDDGGRLAVVHHRTDVERVPGEDDPDLGPLRRRIALDRQLLEEPIDRRRRGPGRIAQHVAVEGRRLHDGRGRCGGARQVGYRRRPLRSHRSCGKHAGHGNGDQRGARTRAGSKDVRSVEHAEKTSLATQSEAVTIASRSVSPCHRLS